MLSAFYTYVGKFVDVLPKKLSDVFGRDKIMHFVVGSLVSILWCLVSVGVLKLSAFVIVVGSLFLPLIFGIGKEILDYITNKKLAEQGKKAQHSVDPLDIVATALGGVIPTLLLVAISAKW